MGEWLKRPLMTSNAEIDDVLDDNVVVFKCYAGHPLDGDFGLVYITPDWEYRMENLSEIPQILRKKSWVREQISRILETRRYLHDQHIQLLHQWEKTWYDD